MKTYEFDGEKYKIASTPQKEWGKALFQTCLYREMKEYWI